MTDTRRYLVSDLASREWADDTFTRRDAAIEKAEEALQQIREVETTLREAAEFLNTEDPLIHRILSYPMSWDAAEGDLREDIKEWKRDQNDLETEIRRYDASHNLSLDNAPYE